MHSRAIRKRRFPSTSKIGVGLQVDHNRPRVSLGRLRTLHRHSVNPVPLGRHLPLQAPSLHHRRSGSLAHSALATLGQAPLASHLPLVGLRLARHLRLARLLPARRRLPSQAHSVATRPRQAPPPLASRQRPHQHSDNPLSVNLHNRLHRHSDSHLHHSRRSVPRAAYDRHSRSQTTLRHRLSVNRQLPRRLLSLHRRPHQPSVSLRQLLRLASLHRSGRRQQAPLLHLARRVLHSRRLDSQALVRQRRNPAPQRPPPVHLARQALLANCKQQVVQRHHHSARPSVRQHQRRLRLVVPHRRLPSPRHSALPPRHSRHRLRRHSELLLLVHNRYNNQSLAATPPAQAQQQRHLVSRPLSGLLQQPPRRSVNLNLRLVQLRSRHLPHRHSAEQQHRRNLHSVAASRSAAMPELARLVVVAMEVVVHSARSCHAILPSVAVVEGVR